MLGPLLNHLKIHFSGLFSKSFHDNMREAEFKPIDKSNNTNVVNTLNLKVNSVLFSWGAKRKTIDGVNPNAATKYLTPIIPHLITMGI